MTLLPTPTGEELAQAEREIRGEFFRSLTDMEWETCRSPFTDSMIKERAVNLVKDKEIAELRNTVKELEQPNL